MRAYGNKDEAIAAADTLGKLLLAIGARLCALEEKMDSFELYMMYFEKQFEKSERNGMDN